MKKTALVLSGGGAKGAFQVGVMEKLMMEGFKPDAIYGTSVGALNAAGYCRLGFEGLREEWLKIQGRGDIMSFNWLKMIGTLGLFADGMYSMDPLRRTLEGFAKLPMAHPECKAVVTKVSLLTGALEYAQTGDPDFLDSVVASASIPIINSPVNGYVDGGVREQIPLSKAIADGYTDIVCIVNNPWHTNPEAYSYSSFLALAKILIRVADGIQSCETFVNDIKTVLMLNGHPAYANINLTLYMPDRLLIDTQQFDPVLIRQVMQQGRDTEPFDLTRIV